LALLVWRRQMLERVRVRVRLLALRHGRCWTCNEVDHLWQRYIWRRCFVGTSNNFRTHAKVPEAFAKRTTECIILIHIHSKAKATSRKLVELAFAKRFLPKTFNVKLRTTLVFASRALVCKSGGFRWLAMLCHASKVLNCGLATTLITLVDAIFAFFRKVEMLVCELICYRL